MLLSSPMPSAPRHRGFTLIELMVTIAIVAILAALAAPSLQAFVVRNTFASIGNEFQGSLLRARTEAVSKNSCTTMCMSDTIDNASPFCKQSDQDWQVGWIVFLNTQCDAAYGTNATSHAIAAQDLILVRRPGNASYTLMAQSSTQRIQFTPRGTTAGIDRFDLDHTTLSTDLVVAHAFNICLDLMGRTRSIPATRRCDNF
jgi:type IV fimbrial biogenesis protein FimT